MCRPAGTASLVLGSPVVGGSTALTIGTDGTSTTYSGSISDRASNYSGAAGSIIKVGTGTLTLSGSDTYTGGTNVSSGTLALGSSNALPVASALSIAAGAAVSLVNHAALPITVAQASVLSNSGLIDVVNNDLVIKGGGPTGYATAYSQIKTGFNGGTWNGSSTTAGVITSSTAAADTSDLTAVGIATNLTSFEGLTVATSDVLIKYTYYGDANLDGAVDGSDYTLIDAGFNGGLTGWQNGDFNYDGVVDGSDYTLIDNAFNTQGASLGVNPASLVASSTAQIAGTSSVPEPTSPWHDRIRSGGRAGTTAACAIRNDRRCILVCRFTSWGILLAVARLVGGPPHCALSAKWSLSEWHTPNRRKAHRLKLSSPASC